MKFNNSLIGKKTKRDDESWKIKEKKNIENELKVCKNMKLGINYTNPKYNYHQHKYLININNKRKDIHNIIFNCDFSDKEHLFSESDNKCKIFYNANKNLNKYKQNIINFAENLEKRNCIPEEETQFF